MVKSTMEFPEKSQRTTDEKFTWDEVKALLDKEFMRRGEYVARILTALKEKFGDEVFDIAKKVIYDIGYKKGKARAEKVKANNEEPTLEKLSKLIDHKISHLYFGTTPELIEGKLTIREYYCPLPRKWKEMGFSDEEIVNFCLIFDQVDRGMAEGYNENFKAELSGCKSLSEKGCCQTIISKK